MKVAEIRLHQERDKSFIIYHETHEFSPWHHHPEFELVLITKGRGKRMIGDHIDRFEVGDLVLIGPYLPHEWHCDQEFYLGPGGFIGEGYVIQFQFDFLGPKFFDIPENQKLRSVLNASSRGILLRGKGHNQIAEMIIKAYNVDTPSRLYILFEIFYLLMEVSDPILLASPGFMEPYHTKENEPLQKAIQFIHQNFQQDIGVKQMLEVTNMSNTTFCLAFKKMFRMTFKEYLLTTRIGYACKLLTSEAFGIAQIAYHSGFENISNFNRQFKKIKGITPSKFQENLLKKSIF